MITRVWIMIALLLALAIVPVMLLQLRMERESLELVFELTGKLPLRNTLDEHMQLLKSAAVLDAANEVRYRAKFQDVLNAKQALDEFLLLKGGLIENIRGQVIRNAAITLFISLMLSLAVSSRIVRDFKRLLEERHRAARERERLASLERWQDVARMLVHELKAPLTPIKLIATDIEQKFESLDQGAFRAYLASSQALIREQVNGLDGMVQSFTRFGKLPPVKLEATDVRGFLDAFHAVYEHEFKGRAALVCEDSLPPGYKWDFDPKLVRDLLFNLTKNAVEANEGAAIRVRIVAFKDAEALRFRVHNTGQLIAAEVAVRLFEPYFSGRRTGGGTPNMGLGLSICRKIALDHGGDLQLIYNDVQSGVVFECVLPEQRSSEVV